MDVLLVTVAFVILEFSKLAVIALVVLELEVEALIVDPEPVVKLSDAAISSESTALFIVAFEIVVVESDVVPFICTEALFDIG